jgi:hypothetical protein
MIPLSQMLRLGATANTTFGIRLTPIFQTAKVIRLRSWRGGDVIARKVALASKSGLVRKVSGS